MDEYTNEQIVELIRQGRTDLYLTLWYRVKRFVGNMAWTRIHGARGFDGHGAYGSVELDDLVQSGYLAMVKAVKTYDSAGGKFLTWLAFYLRSSFNEAQGLRTSAKNPIDRCISLDRPISAESEDTIGDFIPSGDNYDGVEEKIYNGELRAALERALTEIPARQAEILRKTAFEQRTIKECGSEFGVSVQRASQLRKKGLASMRRNKGLREFLGDHLNYYSHVSKASFNSTHQSSTEQLAFRRIELERLYEEILRESLPMCEITYA